MSKLPTVREFAREQGFEGTRGRFPAEILAAYQKTYARALAKLADGQKLNDARIAAAREVDAATVREYLRTRAEKLGVEVGVRGLLSDEHYLTYAKAKRLKVSV